MCLSPISIINRSRRFDPLKDKARLIVPCGHCEQCQKRKQDDWFFRAVAEMKRVTKCNGYVWFPTLTYRNQDLPRWIDKEFNYNIPVFDKAHFVSFRTKLRVYLKRKGYDLTGDNTLRYLYVCEYGTEKGRSHLHTLIFVPSFVKYADMYDCVRRAWIYGFVMYSKKGAKVSTVKCLQYVMKYMHKDQLYYDTYKIDDYILKLNDLSKNIDLDADIRDKYKARLLEFKRHLPHHCQSMGFGSSMVLSDDDFIRGIVSASRLDLVDKSFVYNIPMYYKRKFLYDFDKVNNVYQINPRGVHIKQMSFNNLVNSLVKYYDSVIYSNRIEDICKSDFPQLLNDDYLYFHRNKQRIDTNDLALYALCYRGLTVPKIAHQSMDKMPFVDFLKQCRENAYTYFMANVDSVVIHDDYLSNGAYEASKCHCFSLSILNWF